MISDPIHFIGIGGIGMSGIAQALLEDGHTISGSDINENQNVIRLRDIGAKIFVGHEGGNIRDAKTVVLSTAVKKDNPEYLAAQSKGLPILHRSEMLAHLMAKSPERVCISGTHGKTTTTTLMAALFEEAGTAPTVINGGIMNAYGTNAKMGSRDCFIIEADESDGSFTRFSPTISVVSNIDPEHMDHYGDFEALMTAFETFVNNTEDDGCVILGIDHPDVRTLHSRISHPNLLTFGYADDATFQARNLKAQTEGTHLDVFYKGEMYIEGLKFKAYGEHNVLNALSAIAAAHHCGHSKETISKALSEYQGVQRRFTSVGEWNKVTFIDDYAHHPVEIQATLSSARKACDKNVIAVLQPHRFSRLKNLFEDFTQSCSQAHQSIILPVYPAGETPIPGIDHLALAKEMPGKVQVCEDAETLVDLISEACSPGDMVVCMGAGNISTIARKLPGQLTASKPTSQECA